MISAVRDYVLALACLRRGLPVALGRGMDRLTLETTDVLAETLVGSLDSSDSKRAFGAVTEAPLREIQEVDGPLANRLAGRVYELSRRL